MSFLNTCSTIIRRSNKDMFLIRLEKGIIVDYFNNENELISSKKIITKNNFDFTKLHFTLDKDDTIYGVYIDDNLNLIKIPSNSSEVSVQEIINYDNENFNISFPYLNYTNGSINILYYVYNFDNPNSCAIFHHSKENNNWIENKIDFINNTLLDNYSIVQNQNSLVVFYFKLVNSHEELFFSQYNVNNFTWSKPVKITNSGKNKLYLSVIKDNMNFYHITYCEKVKSGYSVKYVNGFLNDGHFDVESSSYLSKPSNCMYPSLVKKGSIINIIWVEFGRLKTRVSSDFGKTWDEPHVDEFSVEEDFERAYFLSNYKDDLPYNISSVFTTSESIGILGF